MPRYWMLSIYKLAMGDKITFYIPRKRVDSLPNDLAERVRKIRRIARIKGEAFESNEKMWHVRSGELFPHRRQVEFL
jgi:hypothetical protein